VVIGLVSLYNQHGFNQKRNFQLVPNHEVVDREKNL
jgi:hypothetical protein